MLYISQSIWNLPLFFAAIFVLFVTSFSHRRIRVIVVVHRFIICTRVIVKIALSDIGMAIVRTANGVFGVDRTATGTYISAAILAGTDATDTYTLAATQAYATAAMGAATRRCFRCWGAVDVVGTCRVIRSLSILSWLLWRFRYLIEEKYRREEMFWQVILINDSYDQNTINIV